MKASQDIKIIALLLSCLALSQLVITHAQNYDKLIEIERPDNTISIFMDAPNNLGAEFISLNVNCREDADLSIFVAPPDYLVEMTFNNTRVTSQSAVVVTPLEGEQSADLYGGQQPLDEVFCPSEFEPPSDTEVIIYEGETVIRGQRFLYDNASGTGDLQGPILLERRQEGNEAGLTANADQLKANIDDDLLILEGAVTLNSNGRQSEADILEYDEDRSIAILRGNPARSSDEDGTIEGAVIEYDLDTNDVVVLEQVHALFIIDE